MFIFDLIGITETGLKYSSASNYSIEGYVFEVEYTRSNKGGARQYISKTLTYLACPELNISVRGSLE